MRETAKAKQAFEDYFNLGPGRSLDKLRQKYGEKTAKNPPTKHLRTLETWSSTHKWQERVAERDAQLAQVAFEALKDEATQTGYALYQKRLLDLNELAETLFDELKDDDKRWPYYWKNVGTKSDPEMEKVHTFNSQLSREFREVLDDIAVEMGERRKDTGPNEPSLTEATPDFSIPAEMLAGIYLDVYRDIRAQRHNEYLFYGGRGSLKSSFVSEAFIERLINNPDMHGLATRQLSNTLKDSVFSQLRWAIMEMGLEDKFRHTLNPLEIEYLPTGQKIYFRGGDDPVKIKSIKPTFGYIGILWFEELDQFRGAEAVRSIVQSAVRGGDIAYIFKTLNTPRSKNNWANKELEIPKDNRFVHFSNYLDVPSEWLGKAFLDEAEFLKAVNPDAYDHEYGGIATGTGGKIFENVEIREITDEEIANFDRVTCGLDWGYFPDPFHFGRVHYDAARLTLYIFDEYRAHKKSNRATYDHLVKEKGLTPNELIIADSAEPKSVADYKAYGAKIIGAEKGPDSVDYSIKWLQSLLKIVIDEKRAPHSADEFLNFEHEQDKDGEYISAYPDKDNHAIDAVGRYATNLIWRVRGQ